MRPVIRVLVLLVFTLAAACSAGTEATPTSTPVADPLKDAARREGKVGVIVQLAVTQERPGTWDRREIAREQRKLVDYLGAGATVVTRYDELPQLALTLTPRALEKLRAYPKVTSISLNSTDESTE